LLASLAVKAAFREPRGAVSAIGEGSGLKDDNSEFEKFLRTARRGKPATEAAEAPFGFSTRVAARWLAQREDPLVPWEKLAHWGAITALIIALLVVVTARPQPTVNPLAALAIEAQSSPDAL
jgi:hypothetical protein